MCVKCGVSLKKNSVSDPYISDKSCVTVFLLCTFLGFLGAHRFYVGKVSSGIFQLLTLGALGIWSLIDWIVIITGNFTDCTHRKITWSRN